MINKDGGAIEIMDRTKPVKKQCIFVQDIGREVLLYSAQERVFHILNPTAKTIWELCDGKHTVKDMEQVIRTKFSFSNGHNVVKDIQQILDTLADKGVLEK